MQLGWRVERLTNWRVPEELRGVEEPVLYLEGLMGPTLAAEFGLALTEVPEDWLPRLPEEYRKRRVERITLREARGRSGRNFVKPPNDKSFPAKVYLGTELPEFTDDEVFVLSAEVVEWVKEFRCFILDRRVLTFSVYLRNGVLQRENDFYHTPEEEAEVKSFIKTVLADERVDLPKAAVVDVGVIAGRGWAVVEQNAAWGSGLYGCDPAEVLRVLQQSASRVQHR